MSFTGDRRVGRLIELRVFELRDADAVRAYGEATLALVRRAPGEVLVCADHRPARIYPAPVVTALVGLFEKINPRLLRAALLVSEANATFAMQVQRIVASAGNDQRRVFFDADEAARWLAEVATPAEQARLRAHLTEGATALRPPPR